GEGAFEVRAADDREPPGVGTAAVAVTVHDVNRAPTLGALEDVQAEEDVLLAIPLGAADPDGDEVVVLLNGLTADAGYDAESGELRWTPRCNDHGEYEASVTVREVGRDPALETTATFTITVADANCAPRFEGIADVEVPAGEEAELVFSV